jgi:type IV secretory pathway TraG/TraD family ATPase VirD4
VFNPEGIGGYESTFRWNPLVGCVQPAVAMQRASAFTAATDSHGLQDMAFWIGKASAALACFMHAAALTGRTMTDIYQWAHGIDDTVPEQILATHPGAAPGWLGPVREIRKPGRAADSVRMTVTRALAWLADPEVAAATTPEPGDGFDVAEFVSAPNTLYMIGGGREDAPIAPLFRAFAEYVHAGAALTGSLQLSAKLDPPLLLALDEVTQICPVPLPLWMADSAGKGILIVAVCHGLAQLEDRWESTGARAIWDTAGIKVILGGVSDPDTLDRLSRLCGEVALRTRSHSRGRDGHWGDTISYEIAQVLPPELLRTLPDGRALVIRGNLSPVVIRLRMAWRRFDFIRASLLARSSREIAATTVSGLPARASDISMLEAFDDGSGTEVGDDDGADGGSTGWTPPTNNWPNGHSRPAWRPPADGGSIRPHRPWEPPADGEAVP